MKLLILKSIFLIFVATGFTTLKTNNTNSNETTVIATFGGYDELGYNFSFINEEEEEEEIITFESISESLLKKYNLKDEAFIGKKFKITYTIEISENDEYDTETYILKDIKESK